MMVEIDYTQQLEHVEIIKYFVNRFMDFQSNVRSHKILQEADDETIQRIRSTGIPKIGRPIDKVVDEMIDDVYENQMLCQHPRFFSFVPSSVSLLSIMGSVFTDIYNPHGGGWSEASGACCVEQTLVRWMCSLAGYPDTCGGIFVSGGSMATLTALAAARDNKLSENEFCSGTAYVSDQTHSSVAKALKIIGFRKDQIRVVKSTDDFKMDVAELKKTIESDIADGKKPFAVIGSACTTNTGTIDPLDKIADVCREYNLWFHVDGAFGGSILVSDTYRHMLKGIEHSDSISWDTHKWLMQTYSCSTILVRDQSTLLKSFVAHPEYLDDVTNANEHVDPWDLGIEMTRPHRSLKLWLTLQVEGSDAMAEVVDHSFHLSRLAESEVRKYPNWEIVSGAETAVINFRYAPEGYTEAELDMLNSEISKEMSASGYALVLTTTLKGKKVLRLCTLISSTTDDDVASTIRKLDDIAKKISAK